MADDNDPRIEFGPGQSLTNRELTIDFYDFPPDAEVVINIAGPGSPYWATLKTDPTGRTQLIWRTSAAGDYSIRATAGSVKASESFTISPQEGEEEGPPAMTVEEPGDHGDTPSRELKADEHDPELSPEQDDPAFKPAGSSTKRRTTRKGK